MFIPRIASMLEKLAGRRKDCVISIRERAGNLWSRLLDGSLAWACVV